jgi:hypothetical protein
LRHDISAEELGLIEPEPLTGDRILNLIAAEPEVHAALIRLDGDLPDTVYRVAAARLRAQERLGIPADKRVLLYSSEAETLLTPPLMKVASDLMAAESEGSDCRIPLVELLRRQLRAYRELADFALMSALREYGHAHPHIERLREAARALAATAPAV